MDNLALDMMLDEYEKGQKAAADEIVHHRTTTAETVQRKPSPPPPFLGSAIGGSVGGLASSSIPLSSPSRESDILTEDTVPVSDAGDTDGPAADIKRSVDSSSSSDFNKGSSGSSSGGVSSLYQPGFTAPTINYEKESSEQKLVAVIGREFDQPMDVARNLQEVLAEFENADSAKFVPFMVKRKTLLRGSFNTKDLGNHDLICLCYNASEARILLTGEDGFYTTLLRQIEALLGPNKVAFLITNYTAPLNALVDYEPAEEDLDSFPHRRLISTPLKTRLSHQEPLRIYLEQNQVLSWSDEPERHHVERLLQLTRTEPNPQSFFAANSCSII